MYEIRDNRNNVIKRVESLAVAKGIAIELAAIDEKFNFIMSPFSIYEVKQVWTTQTLDEAMKENEK